MDDVSVLVTATCTDYGLFLKYLNHDIHIVDGSSIPYQVSFNGRYLDGFMDFRQAIDFINEIQ